MTAPALGGAQGSNGPGSGGDARHDPPPGTHGTLDTHTAFGDPTRRTYLAQERTLLAWWRTALGTIAVAVAIGKFLPTLAQLPKAPYVALGAGYAALSLWLVLLGSYRQWAGERALARRQYHELHRGMLIALTAYLAVLVAATAWVLFWGPESKAGRVASPPAAASNSPITYGAALR